MQLHNKMNFYLSVVDEQLRTEGDNPSIGLILCRDKNKLVAEYSLKDMTKSFAEIYMRSSFYI